MVLYCNRPGISIGGFSSADWNVRSGGIQQVLSYGTGAMPVSTSGDTVTVPVPVPVAAHPLRMSPRLTRRQSNVLENRDLCRIVAAYIPATPMQGSDRLFHAVDTDQLDDYYDRNEEVEEEEGWLGFAGWGWCTVM